MALLIPSEDPKAPPTVSSTTTAPTLRRLLSHSAGFAYEHPGTLIAKWRASLSDSSPYHTSSVAPAKAGNWNIVKQFTTPLSFVPGTPGKWQYSPSIEYVSPHLLIHPDLP